MNTHTNTHLTGDGTDDSAIDHTHGNRGQANGEVDRLARSGRRPVNDRGVPRRQALAAKTAQPSPWWRRRPELRTILGLSWLAAILGGIGTFVLKATPPDPGSSPTFVMIIVLVAAAIGVLAIVLALLYWRCDDCGSHLRSTAFEVPQYCANCGSPTRA